jgi:tryptophan-rich sensory protein
LNKFIPLAGFIVLTLGGGTLLGLLSVPGPWYEALAKPAFNPPNWLFGPVWSVLYVLIGIAGWRIWRLARRSLAMSLWWLQLGLNFIWTPVFFVAHQIGLALVVIAAMLAMIVGFVVAAWHRDRAAALLFVPYALWVAFATLLNGAIWWLN